MARREDFPRRLREEMTDKVERAAEGPQRGEEAPADVRPPGELVADARLRDAETKLIAQLEQARAEEVLYEDRYGSAFDEFQASFDPQAGEELSEEYLAWSRAAERVRMLRYELARLAERRKRRARSAAPAAEEPEESGGRRSVS